jgi:hypothetical protein
MPVDAEITLDDTLAVLRPNLLRYKSFDEATEAIKV